MDEKQVRSDYLIEWRKGLWIQIRQKESVIWQYITFYVGALVIVAGLIEVSPGSGFATIKFEFVLLFAVLNLFLSLLGLLIVLDANFWMQRNLLFVGNIEREILREEDFGSLLPATYARITSFGYSRGYQIQIGFFFILALCSLLIVGFSMLNFFATSTPDLSIRIPLLTIFSLIFNGGWLILLARDEKWVEDFFRVRKSAPGKNPEPIPLSEDQRKLNVYTNSPIVRWVWILGGLGSSFLLSFVFSGVFFNANFYDFGIIIFFILLVFTLLGFKQLLSIGEESKNYAGKIQSQEDINEKTEASISSRWNFLRNILFKEFRITLFAWILVLLFLVAKLISQ